MSGTVTATGDWLSLAGDAAIAQRGALILGRSQWRQQIVSLGQRLLSRPESRWALCFDDSYLFSVALLATLHAGKVPVIPGHCRQSLLQEQADEFDALLCDQPLSLDCPVWPLNEAVQAQPDGTKAAALAGDALLPPIAADACIILFTSGSTGKPRKVSRPVSCLDEEARWLAGLWGERLLNCTFVASVSHQHLYGLTFRIILPLALGQPFDSRQIAYSEQLPALDSAQRYVFITSPAFIRRLDTGLPAPACQLIVSAGGVLPRAEAQRAAAWFQQPVAEIYGSTETGVLATRIATAENRCWQPFSQVQFSAENQHWRVRSPLIPHAEGLLLDDRLTFSSTGFELGERHDRTVKIEDKRVSLSDIERRLLALPGVQDAAALVISRPGRSSIGVVLALESVFSEVALKQLKRQWGEELKRWLEPVAIPRYWRVVDTIPQNSQSKRAWPQIQELFHAAR